jgi:hypothetical protein
LSERFPQTAEVRTSDGEGASEVEEAVVRRLGRVGGPPRFRGRNGRSRRDGSTRGGLVLLVELLVVLVVLIILILVLLLVFIFLLVLARVLLLELAVGRRRRRLGPWRARDGADRRGHGLVRVDDGAVLVELDGARERAGPGRGRERAARGDVALLEVRVLLELIVVGIVQYLELLLDCVPAR